MNFTTPAISAALRDVAADTLLSIVSAGRSRRNLPKGD